MASRPPDVAVARVVARGEGHRAPRARTATGGAGAVAGVRAPDVSGVAPGVRCAEFVLYVAAAVAVDATVVAHRAAPVGSPMAAPRAVRQVPRPVSITTAPGGGRASARGGLAAPIPRTGPHPPSGTGAVPTSSPGSRGAAEPSARRVVGPTATGLRRAGFAARRAIAGAGGRPVGMGRAAAQGGGDAPVEAGARATLAPAPGRGRA